MTSLVTEKAIKKNVWQMPESSKYLRENLVLDNGHLLDQVLKRNGILPRIGAWDDIAEQMLLEFAESGHPTFRATTPLSRGILKSKGRGKLSIHFAADDFTSDTIFRIILSVNQLSVYGAVAAVCEEFGSHQDRSGKPEILMGQSIVLGKVKAEAPLQNENPMNDQILWQQYIERIESLSPESKVSRFCVEAGFMRVVDVGQYFMTKDTGNLRQFRPVACREYTLPRDYPASEAKGWIQGNMRIGPALEVTTSFQNSKHGIEIRIWSVGQDISQSWVRISHGTNKYVIDSNHNNTEIPADPHEDQAPQTSIKVIAARSKAKAKPQQREPPLIRQLSYRCTKENGLTLSHQNHLSLRTKSRSKLVQQSCGEVQHVKFSQLTQPKPKPICDRSGKPEDTEHVFVDKGKTSRSHEIDEKAFAQRTWFFR